ncbi:hypothetical protein [Nostoc sp. ChiQUE01b]|uniref:hypothetical protein n=1 Tax=Nostoc sp. ChiQUE01b TaxID=3075376 RepID=UPI002AD3989D|nr:hypothetical protein [Nostoc sp. ChiQUE01b]MDZ8258080.1 hypothetical protein [Nostoc sp. ChiQUE01b]
MFTYLYLKIVNACGMLLQFFEIWNNFKIGQSCVTRQTVVDITIQRVAIGAAEEIKSSSENIFNA